MFRRFKEMVVFFCAALLVVAIAYASQSSMPGPSPADLWEYITQEDPYRKWNPFPGLTEPFLQVTEEPHGDWVAVYANRIAYDSMYHPLDPFTMRYGSILVKENYPAGSDKPSEDDLLSITVMYKINGYHSLPGEEEWFWVMYTPQGEVATLQKQPFASKKEFEPYKGEVQAGKPYLCLSCHQAARTSSRKAVGDYVWKLKPFAGVKGSR